MKQLSQYFKGYLKETFFGPLFKLLEASFELLVPIIIARIVDQVIPHENKGQLGLMIATLFGLALIGITVSLSAQYFSSKAAVGYTKQLTKDLYQKIIRLSKEDRDELTTSSLVTRLTSDTYQIQTGINQFLRLFLRAPIIVFGAIIMSFTISPKMTLWFLGMVVILFIIVFTMSRLLAPVYSQIRKATDKIVNQTREQMQGMRVIRAFGQIYREENQFKNLNNDYTDLQLHAGRLSSLVTPMTYLVVNLTLIAVIWQGNLQIAHNGLSQGMLIALVNYLLQILTELLKMTMLVTSLNQSFISAQRITEVFDKTNEDVDAKIDTKMSDQGLVVNHLSFTYPLAAEPALNNLNFSIAPGQFLGIIGGTGSGKSSVVQLINHLYTPQNGTLSIFKDGKSPESIREWRNWVRTVPQKAELFQGTIRSNLLLGLENVSEDTLWEALDIAQASDFVKEKDGQLDTVVEAFGRNFSGGQRQRLTIARAIVQKAPFLILDDSTSALDYLTEAKLLTAISEKLKGTSLIMVSQRTNSLKQADKILVLDKGYQVGFDTHKALLESNNLYQSIHYSQHRKADD
ncbi:ABC transporter ATP-binding protein [Streptococcus sp. HF-1907]|uniref:ABC transporter ATP-binding protein n=1 Tax=Streptococcus sp. HF-1907 TaxID=2785793 RepID=UPI00189E6E37|nr:ABC transporter ATP-binding protein [Streptococcus sp. HF-1907]MBF7093751.1 ABC transporter ATP-binding protein [Streptococcus sp. HF-1907]